MENNTQTAGETATQSVGLTETQNKEVDPIWDNTLDLDIDFEGSVF